MSDSSIEWTDKTWNPTKGCAKVSEGCTNCYAIRMAARLEAMGQPMYQGITRRSGNRTQWTGKISIDEGSLEAPLRWRKPTRVFVNSMSDLFHEDIPQDFLARVWEVMGRASQHEFQVLTKRPEHMVAALSDKKHFPVLPNVWLGVSVENADHMNRIDILRKTPAAVRFVSLEPLLGPLPGLDLADIDWAIVGGESGPLARPMDESWIGDIKSACRCSGTAFFFKQWGGKNKKKAGRTWRQRTWDEYPVTLSNAFAGA